MPHSFWTMKKNRKHILFHSKQRIWYAFHSKDEYSIHSPFLFDLFTKGLKQKHKPIEDKICEYLKHKMPIVSLNIKDADSNTVNNILHKEDEIAIIISQIRKTPEYFSQWRNIVNKQQNNIFTLEFYKVGVIIQSSKFLRSQHLVLKKR